MEIKNYKKIKSIKSPCGELKESFQEKVGFARTNMYEVLSIPHYHKKLTEYYMVLTGRGVLKVKLKNGQIADVNLKPGIIVKIEPKEIHQTKNLGELKVESISCPAWAPEDEIIVKENLF